MGLSPVPVTLSSHGSHSQGSNPGHLCAPPAGTDEERPPSWSLIHVHCGAQAQAGCSASLGCTLVRALGSLCKLALAWLALKDRGESCSLCGAVPSPSTPTCPSICLGSLYLALVVCQASANQVVAPPLRQVGGGTCGVTRALGRYVAEEPPALPGRVRGLPGGGV